MSKKMLKRSLALGALMAFVITGQAWAAASYIDGEGQPKIVDKNEVTQSEYQYITNDGERVVGGWHSTNGIDTSKVLTSDLKVTAGEFNMVVGGNYIGSSHNMSVSGTNIILGIDGASDDKLKVKQVVGGTGFNSVDGSDETDGRTTDVTILSGTFGGTQDNTDCPEMHVAGGDLLKSFGYAPTSHTIKTVIDKTNVNVSGGTFDAAIYGGSVVTRVYANNGGGELKSTVTNANINITGGTFNDAIVAGGLAWSYNTVSTVTNAVINISGENGNVEFGEKADIFAGGLIDGIGYNNNNNAAKVDFTSINIDNVQVNNIYGTGGKIRPDKIGDPWNGGNGTYDCVYSQNSNAIVNTTLSLTNVTANNVDVPEGSVTLRVEGNDDNSYIKIGQSENATGLIVAEDGSVPVSVEADGEVNDAYAGDYNKMIKERFLVKGYKLLEENEETGETSLNIDAMTVEEGEVMGAATLNSDGTVTVNANQGNTGISDISSVALMAWRAETNDMNKRLGELRNANGEHGVWVRMVRGESEYNSVKNQYNQYQLGYDEKLSVDKSWTVGMALSYTDAESSFSKGSGENTHKGLAIYGSKLNDDGSFVDLIAKYSRLEHDFDLGTAKGDYDTNGYSVSAEYGKRFQQGNGLWIEPQVELTYGQVDSATYMVGGRTVNQDSMESLVGRVGFSLGKDISKGNVYARASYLYDFEGETFATYTKGGSQGFFEQDLGGGWWEVGVGANINLSKATYIYADVEKTFGGEVDTNWQWNLGVRYSF